MHVTGSSGLSKYRSTLVETEMFCLFFIVHGHICKRNPYCILMCKLVLRHVTVCLSEVWYNFRKCMVYMIVANTS